MKVINIKQLKCKNCTKRYVGCHSKCKHYIEWKKAYTEQEQILKEQAKISRDSYSIEDSINIFSSEKRR